MARYAMTVRTPLPPAEAFAYMSDLSNFDEWDPGVSRAEQVAGSGPAKGAEYELDASGSTLRYVVEHFDPPTKVRATASNRFITSVDTITVEADDPGAGSLVTYDADLTLNGPLRLGDPLLKLAFDRIGDRAAKGLVAKLQGTRVG
jgi:carbon monoxide dehydrogenase subunit G